MLCVLLCCAVAPLENGAWRKASLGLKMAPIHPLLESRVGLAASQASVNVDQVEWSGGGGRGRDRVSFRGEDGGNGTWGIFLSTSARRCW